MPDGLRLSLRWCALLVVCTIVGRSASVEAQTPRSRPNSGPVSVGAPAVVDEEPQDSAPDNFATAVLGDSLVSSDGLTTSLKMMALLSILSLAPSILMMTTCFVRFVVVLGLLRQALGTQQQPSNQVLAALAMFLTFLVMSPVWQEAWDTGLKPYARPVNEAERPELEATLERTLAPVRRFMSDQIEATSNAGAVWMFLDYHQAVSKSAARADTYDDVPLTVLLPAFLLSELKTAFLIGIQLYLPFLVIDFVVSTVLVSMGLMMLPPVLVSFPFKLLVFVMIDGWMLTAGTLLDSVRLTG